MVSQGMEGLLTTIVAPIGYGKTALMAEWLASSAASGYSIAWLSLDANDNDPQTLFSYLLSALSQIDSELIQEETGRICGADDFDLDAAVTAFANDLAGLETESLLCLDDFQVIENDAVLDAVRFLIQYAPARLHIVILSRRTPISLPLRLLKTRGQLTAIDFRDLRFTAEETANYFEQALNFGLSCAALDTLQEKTEGWPAGVRMFTRSVKCESNVAQALQSFAGIEESFFGPLLDAAEQPKEVTDFLVMMSMFDRFCASLCDSLLNGVEADTGIRVVTKLASSAEVIEHLVEANMFIVPMDDTGEWYRYHHLFKEYLEARLKAERGLEFMALLGHYGGEWFWSQGKFREAYQYTLSADWEVVTRALGGSAANRYLVKQYLAKIREALERETAADSRKDLEVRLSMIEFALGFIPDPDLDIEPLLLLAQRAYNLQDDSDVLRGSAASNIAYVKMAYGDMDTALHYIRRAKHLNRVNGVAFAEVEACFEEVRCLEAQGLLDEALSVCRESIASLEDRLPYGQVRGIDVGSLHIARGGLLVSMGEFEQAEIALLQGLDMIAPEHNYHYQLAANLGLFTIYEVEGRDREALEQLDMIDAVWPEMSFLSDALRLRFRLSRRSDDPALIGEISGWCARFSPQLGSRLRVTGFGRLGGATGYFLAYLIWADLKIALGQGKEAMAFLDAEIELSESGGLRERLVALLVGKSLALHSIGKTPQAMKVLRRSLEEAQECRLVSTLFLDPAIVGLMQNVAVTPDAAGLYARYLIAFIVGSGRSVGVDVHDKATAYADMTEATRHLPSALSPRELQVLSLVAAGMSNAQVSERLSLKVSSVKQYMNHIMSKLGASHRTEAVAIARERGLLP